jgi:hypothetical protein
MLGAKEMMRRYCDAAVASGPFEVVQERNCITKMIIVS